MTNTLLNWYFAANSPIKPADFEYYRSTAAYGETFATDCVYETCKAVAPLLNHHTFMMAVRDSMARDMENEPGK